MLLFSLSLDPPAAKRRKLDTSPPTAAPKPVPSKLTPTTLPVEFALTRFISNLEVHDPSWALDTPACDWEGVGCNAQGEVIAINWNDEYELAGEPDFTHLPPTLEALELQNNELCGPVPFNALPMKLETLRLSHNAFAGEVEWGALPQGMKYLYLQGNGFVGSVGWSELPVSVLELDLSQNGFTGSFEGMSLPSNMETLDVSENELSGKLDLGELPTSLKSLDLSRNSFSGKVDLSKLPPALKSLHLFHNPLLKGVARKSELPATLSIRVGLGISHTQIRLVKKKAMGTDSQE